ncbi:MAG: peptidase dimerization domain-containing protein [Geminicoccaceae bacterium]
MPLGRRRPLPPSADRGLGEIKVFAPGQLEFARDCRGRAARDGGAGAHRLRPSGVNPIGKAMAILAALDALDRDRGERIHHPRLETAIGRSTNLMVTHIAAGEADVTTRLRRSTCRLRAAVSLVPDEKLDAVMGEIEAAVARAASADPWLAGHPPRIDWLAGVSAAETADTDPFFRTVAGAIEPPARRLRRQPAAHLERHQNPIVQAGILTSASAPLRRLNMAGGVDEWVDLADYRRSVAVVAAIIADWCGTLLADHRPTAPRNHPKTGVCPGAGV